MWRTSIWVQGSASSRSQNARPQPGRQEAPVPVPPKSRVEHSKYAANNSTEDEMELQSTEVDEMALSFLTLQQKQVPFEHGRVSVAKCVLDPKNPRIQYMIGQRDTPATKTDLYDILWDKDQVRYLAQSIRQNGGVYEDVIVQRTDEGFVVREGNCRAVACMHLMEQYPGNSALETMPAKIFDEELTEEQLAVLLADMHVASKIRWDAHEQTSAICCTITVKHSTGCQTIFA